ncbi:MAG: branched-chain amino acid ABC transporter permease [Clostridiales bacterium]|jgi:branched-chain amino acid transport system permease protein|nr:branched-chain amino acid ABC transporter permease [Clostridiales bacterium]
MINGISVGSVYALVALGYTMVYGIVKLINFAHGDIIMVSSYFLMVFLRKAGLPFPLAILLSVALSGALGAIVEKLAYKPLRGAPRINVLITAIGVSILLQNVFAWVFKQDNPASMPALLDGAINIGGVSISKISVLTILVSVILMVTLSLLIKYTKMGKAMRAVSEDSGAAALMGINVDTTVSATFIIGSALAAVAGVLFASTYRLINPFMGSDFGLKAFIAAVLGGIGIIPGAMIGGFIMGVVESLAKGYVSTIFADTIVFTILIVILIFKPSGLLGKNIKEKV